MQDTIHDWMTILWTVVSSTEKNGKDRNWFRQKNTHPKLLHKYNQGDVSLQQTCFDGFRYKGRKLLG